MIVKIETPSDISLGIGTQITTHTGEPIQGVTSVDVHIAVNEPIVARLECYGGFRGTATAVFWMRDPITNEIKDVKRVEFADGTVFLPFAAEQAIPDKL